MYSCALSLALECATGRGLQHTATRYSTLQNTATHSRPARVVLVLPSSASPSKDCHTLQYTTIHFNTLQHTADTAARCQTLQHTATHCNTLQHTPYLHASSQSCPRVRHWARTATHSLSPPLSLFLSLSLSLSPSVSVSVSLSLSLSLPLSLSHSLSLSLSNSLSL